MHLVNIYKWKSTFKIKKGQLKSVFFCQQSKKLPHKTKIKKETINDFNFQTIFFFSFVLYDFHSSFILFLRLFFVIILRTHQITICLYSFNHHKIYILLGEFEVVCALSSYVRVQQFVFLFIKRKKKKKKICNNSCLVECSLTCCVRWIS